MLRACIYDRICLLCRMMTANYFYELSQVEVVLEIQRKSADAKAIIWRNDEKTKFPFNFHHPYDIYKLVLERKVVSIHVGVILYEKHKKSEELADLYLMNGAPLIFDVDINDYCDNRTDCPCGKSRGVCNICWRTYLSPAITQLREFCLELGFVQLQCFFSGRRGFHYWVMDRKAWILTDEQRKMIYTRACARGIKLDEKAMNKQDHLRKMPMLIHSATQYVCTPIDESFLPERDAILERHFTPARFQKCVEQIHKAFYWS
jgi:DNA primase catalytic subunit